MPTSKRIKYADIVAMLRLLGECRELGDDPIVWRRHFYAGLGKLVGADGAAGGEMFGCLNGSLSSPGIALWGFDDGLNVEGLDILWRWSAVDPDCSLLWRAFQHNLRATPDPGITAARPQFVPNRQWIPSPDYQVIMRTIGADATMQSYCRVQGGGDQFDGIAWFRGAGQPEFDEREVALVALFHEELTRLVGGPLARFGEPRPSQLAPRVREVLRCLLEGDGDKQVAARLSLSPHTVNQYTKCIYRHFGVSGRGELLARWLRRGWSSQAAWDSTEPAPAVLIP